MSDGGAEFGDLVIINIVKKALLVFLVAVGDQRLRSLFSLGFLDRLVCFREEIGVCFGLTELLDTALMRSVSVGGLPWPNFLLLEVAEL